MLSTTEHHKNLKLIRISLHHVSRKRRGSCQERKRVSFQNCNITGARFNKSYGASLKQTTIRHCE